ncbi:hypothetical protein [Paracoccus broussonetiae]|nr:hypothetical protein [Paracoccus sp. CPCC 101403]
MIPAKVAKSSLRQLHSGLAKPAAGFPDCADYIRLVRSKAQGLGKMKKV